MKNTDVDAYLIDGCGRCQFYKTENCKVLRWNDEVRMLRKIVLDSGLKEEYKWSHPCYTIDGKNVIIVSAFLHYAAISFFKGALLEDNDNILIQAGKRSQSARVIKFTSTVDIKKHKVQISNLIHQAIALEKAGAKVNFNSASESIPSELKDFFRKRKDLEAAFYNLTPGRQRGYLIHFNQAKQSKTIISRIEKCISKILAGEGLNENYSSKKQ